MKMKLTIILLLATFGVVMCQEDKTFKEQILVEKGIRFGDGTIQLTAPANQSLTWESILNKPSFFSGDYNDLTNKPPTVSLQDVLTEMGAVLVLKRTTSEIASMEAEEGCIVFDTELKVWKGYRNGLWTTLITGQ
jgi:hypothetical protein